MQVDEQRHGAVTVVRPRGAMAGDDARDFGRRLARTGRESLGRVVLDASVVSYVDSVGLEAVLEASDALGEMGRTLKVAQANETVREAMELTGVSSQVELYASVQDVVRSFL